MAEKYDNWCKGLPIYYRDEKKREYCLFHSPQGQKHMALADFNQQILQKIVDAQKKGTICNLSGTIFEGDISFEHFTDDNALPPILFSEAIFNGMTNFEGVTFDGEANFVNVAFKNGVKFWGTRFNGMAQFYKATFDERVYFYGAIFAKDASFNKATFNGEALLSATFKEYASFNKATFNGEANFAWGSTDKEEYKAVFNKEAHFAEVTFNGETYFSGTTFKERVLFVRTTFKDVRFFGAIFIKDADFVLARFTGYSYFLHVEFQGDVSFQESQFEKHSVFHGGKPLNEETIRVREGLFFGMTDFCNVHIKETLRFEEVDLKGVSFLDTDIEHIDFNKCTWHKRFGRNILYDEIAVDSDKKKVVILYRGLKKKYKDKHDELEASKWHYNEKDLQRRITSFKEFFLKTFLTLYHRSSGYGEDPARALIVLSSLAMMLLALLLLPPGLKANLGDRPFVISWAGQRFSCEYLLAVFVAFFQYAILLKEPLLVPTSIFGHFIKTMIQIFIPIQFALFVFALRNKFRR